MQRKLDNVNQIYSIITEAGTQKQNLADFFLDNRDLALILYLYNNDFFFDDNDELGSESTSSNDNDDGNDSFSRIPVPREDCELLTYADFVLKYMEPNLPVLFRPSLIEDWKATQAWKIPVSDGEGCNRYDVNFDYLLEHFGHNEVEVHVQEAAGFDSIVRPRKISMTVSEYIDLQDNDNNVIHSDEEEEEKVHCYYLKDWKFLVQNPEHHDAYTCPKYFEDDWLNASMKSAYKFVYLGQAGTSTRLHADVLSSYSWSTNLVGRKRWHLIPPYYTIFLFDIFGQTLAPHLNYSKDAASTMLYPGLSMARRNAFEIIQEEGETIFVPSGWYHQVENLESTNSTLSINHNWINGYNISWSWQRINRELSRYNERNASSIKDISNMDDTAGPTNESIHGDLLLLWMMLQNRINEIIEDASEYAFEQNARNNIIMRPGKYMLEHDLRAIQPILQELVMLEGKELDFGVSKQCQWSATDMLSVIEKFLDKYCC